MSDIDTQPRLFDDPVVEQLEEAPGDVAVRPVEEPLSPQLDGWFLPTNRHNILRMLAVRAVLPVEALADKYYDDLLKLTPGRLPLVRGGIPFDLAVAVAGEEFDFPILLEIDAEPSGRAAGRTAGGVWCPAGPIPLTMVLRIHFRTDGELTEFQQNEYADVRPAPELYRISPERFAVARAGRELLDRLRKTKRAASPKSIAPFDRRAGALMLSFLIARETTATALVASMRGDPASGESHAVNGLVDWLTGVDPDASPRSADEGEAVLTRRILTTLEGIDRRQAWKPLEIIAGLRATLSADADPADRHLIDVALARAAAILRSDEDFTGLKEGGSAALKALLLVLMRPELERLRADLHDQGIDDDTRLLAAAMLGAMTGRSRLPVDARPVALDDLLAHWECDRLRELDNPTPRFPDLRVERDDQGPKLMAGSATVIRLEAEVRVSQPTPAQEVDAQEAGSADPLETALAVELGRSEAIHIAIEHGWWNAILTTIVLHQEAADVSVRADTKSTARIAMRGHAEVSQELDVLAFVALASDAPDQDAIVARMTDAGVKRRKSRATKPKP